MASTASVTLSGTLVDSSNNGIAGQTIALSYNNGALPSATTSSTGAYSSVVTVPAPGTYTFTGTFAGVPNQYGGSTASTSPLSVVVKTVLTVTVTVN